MIILIDFILRIPLDESKFDDDKTEELELFLNKFFSDSYKCSFVYDDDGAFCLEILKIS